MFIQLRVFLLIFLLAACSSTPDHRIDKNYDDVVGQQKEVQTMNHILETSHEDEPEYVTALLDSWDCGTEFCVVGRAEIEADGASPFSCLEISKISAKANLVSTVKTDLSQRVVHSLKGTSLDKQKLQTLTTSGFTVEGVTDLKTSKNYYRKILKDISGAPVAVYQCFSVASLNKRKLKQLIEQEAEKSLTQKENSQFKKQVDRIWESIFKVDSPVSRTTPYYDEAARSSIIDRSGSSLEDLQSDVVRVARAFMGLPYQLGGSLSKGTLDCSNYMRTIYKAVGFKLPRISPQQFSDERGFPVTSDFEKGDLLFFNGSLRPSDQVSHVGMYIGDGQMIHASGDQKKVLVDNFYSDRWQRKFLGGKRFITPGNFPVSSMGTLAQIRN